MLQRAGLMCVCRSLYLIKTSPGSVNSCFFSRNKKESTCIAQTVLLKVVGHLENSLGYAAVCSCGQPRAGAL